MNCESKIESEDALYKSLNNPQLSYVNPDDEDKMILDGIFESSTEMRNIKQYGRFSDVIRNQTMESGDNNLEKDAEIHQSLHSELKSTSSMTQPILNDTIQNEMQEEIPVNTIHVSQEAFNSKSSSNHLKEENEQVSNEMALKEGELNSVCSKKRKNKKRIKFTCNKFLNKKNKNFKKSFLPNDDNIIPTINSHNIHSLNAKEELSEERNEGGNKDTYGSVLSNLKRNIQTFQEKVNKIFQTSSTTKTFYTEVNKIYKILWEIFKVKTKNLFKPEGLNKKIRNNFFKFIVQETNSKFVNSGLKSYKELGNKKDTKIDCINKSDFGSLLKNEVSDFLYIYFPENDKILNQLKEECKINKDNFFSQTMKSTFEKFLISDSHKNDCKNFETDIAGYVYSLTYQNFAKIFIEYFEEKLNKSKQSENVNEVSPKTKMNNVKTDKQVSDIENIEHLLINRRKCKIFATNIEDYMYVYSLQKDFEKNFIEYFEEKLNKSKQSEKVNEVSPKTKMNNVKTDKQVSDIENIEHQLINIINDSQKYTDFLIEVLNLLFEMLQRSFLSKN